MIEDEQHEIAADDGLDWTLRLKELQRIEPDPADDDPWRTCSP